MIADVILGINIDTSMWIEDLKNYGADAIVVIDYEYFGEFYIRDKVTYISALEAKKVLGKFDSLNFYKSIYIYPGSKSSPA